MEQKNTRLRNVGFITFFFSGICAISSGVVVSLLQEQYGFAYGMTGTLLSLMSIGNLLAGFLIAMLPGKLGMKPSILLLTIGYALGYAMMGLSGAVAVLALGFFLVGIAKGSVINTCTILVSDNSADRTRGMNLMHSCYACGALLCPFLIAAAARVSTALAVFLLAAACAVVISVVSLKVLFTAFLEIRHDSLAWLIFHVEPMNILLHLAVFFVTLGLSLGMALHRYSREPARALLYDMENEHKVKRGRKPLRRRFTPAATLCGLWRSRTNRSLRSCLAVSVPVMAVFLLLFNILTLALQVTGAEEEWGLKVSRSSHDGEGFSTEDIAYVSSLVGVKQMRPVYEPDGYILLPESPEEVETPLRIRPYSDLGAAAQTLSKYEIAVSRKAERGVGDVLRLCRSEAYCDVNGGIKQPASEDVTALTVAALTDTKPSGWALDIYVSDELYADIIASEPATGIEIALTDPAMNAQVEAALRTHFAGAEYAVTNRQSGSDFLREMSSGVYLLLGYIFAALFLFILLILYVRLCDYIEGSRPLIRSLYRLGASKRTLYRSYIRQDGISAAAAVAAPFLISLPLTALLCVWQKAPLHLDGGMLAVYAALSVLLLFTYWHPVHRSLKRVLRPL